MDLLGRVPQKTLAKAPNISVHVTLDSPNVNFNFAALAEDKYGWDALHPVAARLRAINKYESDEESDSEAQALGDDSAANERQSVDGRTGIDAAQLPRRKRKRRKDMEYYDVTDPFIDDDELVLQERTAASKDGFFVFSGPLVAEGEKVRIEKADGSQRRAGGKGSRGGRSTRPRPASTTNSNTKPSARPKPGVDKAPEPVAPKSVKAAEQVSASNGDAMVGMVVVPPLRGELPSHKSVSNDAADQANTVALAGPDPVSTADTRKQTPMKTLLMTTASTNNSAPSTETVKSASLPIITTPSTNGTQRATEQPKATKKKAPPTTTSTKKNTKPSNPTSAAIAEPTAPPGTPAAVVSPTVSALHSPCVNPDGSAKKVRKPAREKTVEEKAELARKAREARERKRIEKKAQEDAERAALLARAIANPNIDTRGISLNPLTGVLSTSPGSAEKLKQSRATLDAGAKDLDATLEMQVVKEEMVKQSVLGAEIISEITALEGLKRTESPIGRSMSVEAILD